VNNPDKTVKFNGMEWYVIADNSMVLDDGTLTLLAKYPISSEQFNPKGGNNKYSTSAIKNKLDKMTLGIEAPTLKTYGQTGEGISAEATIPSGSFMSVSDAIASTDLEDVGVTDAKLYLLSEEEALALDQNIRKCTRADGSSFQYWFLRTPNPYQSQMAKTIIAGTGNVFVQYVKASEGIRPAMKLDLNKVKFNPETETFDHTGAEMQVEISYYRASKSGDTYTKTGDALSAAPVNAGDYIAEAKVTIGDYTDTAFVGYTIAKAEPVMNLPTGLTANYGQTLGDVPLTNQEGNTPGTWTWYLREETSVGDVGNNTFYAVFNPEDKLNYASGKLKELTITVNKIDPIFTAPTGKSVAYSRDAQELVIAGETDDGTMYYAIGEDETTAPKFDGTSEAENKKWSTAIPSKADIGTYYVWYKLVGDKNHNDSEPDVVEAKIVVPFVDVTEGKYYYDAVAWAISQDDPITAGVDETHFAPSKNCNRSQAVTFLWRAAGCETVDAENPFADVKDGKFYAAAVLWAYAKGITSGKTADTFAPSAACTRAEFVTFLWRMAGSPEVTDVENPFEDVADGKYYTQAVLWAYGNGIAAGTDDTHFSPKETVNRGQAITFIYRYCTDGE